LQQQTFVEVVHLLCPPCIHTPRFWCAPIRGNLRNCDLVNMVPSSVYCHGWSFSQGTVHSDTAWLFTEMQGCFIVLVVHLQSCSQRNVLQEGQQLFVQKYVNVCRTHMPCFKYSYLRNHWDWDPCWCNIFSLSMTSGVSSWIYDVKLWETCIYYSFCVSIYHFRVVMKYADSRQLQVLCVWEYITTYCLLVATMGTFMSSVFM
jgi:hypothetical protein